MNKIVYITGCFGFIGSYITKKLLDNDFYVRGIDSMTYASNNDNLTNYLFHSHFDFDKENINKLTHLYDCDYFINCCAESHVDNSIENSKIFLDTNVNGVHHLLELIRNKNPYKRPIFLQISTDEVYGDIIKGSHKETDLLKPSNPYSATKACADMLVQAWYRTFGLDYLIVRPTNNFGIFQSPEKLIPRAIKSFNLEKKIALHNQGKPTRTWLHAEDTAEAILTIINSGIKNEIFNISGGLEKTNIEVIHTILKYYLNGKDYNINDYVNFSYNRPGQDVRYSLDDSKLRALGWSPKKNFDEEVKKMVEYYSHKFVW